AVSFATPDQKSDVRDIEKIIRSTLPVSKHPEIPHEQFIESRGSSFQAKPQQRHNTDRHKFNRPRNGNKKFYR
ncbi:MAG: hypothetical protein PHV98_07090, partial [Candidatus Omnitrophica bacterium]|nr:hypothetical protein [Candidatus Omnitrophota bacterium]